MRTSAPRRLVAAPMPVPVAPLTFAAQTRGKGKRERTRARLIDAAAELIASGGPDSATIFEITATAGLASGTFYNHFVDRAEIIAETAVSIVDQISAQINAAGEDEEDIVIRLATGTRRFLDIAYSHPTWAWAMLRAMDYLPALRPRIYQHIGRTVHIGHEDGVFADYDDYTLFMLRSIVFAGLRARLMGLAGPEVGARVAEMQLRVLGIEADRAADAVRRPIVELAFTWPLGKAHPPLRGRAASVAANESEI